MCHKPMNSVKLPIDHINARQINHNGLSLELALLETDSLLVHEEIVPIRFNELMKHIKRDGFQSAPVLVDRDTLVVLDGMHRTAVMKELGAQYICVCLLDYFSPSIKIQRWCRVISAPFTEEIAESLLRSIGFNLEPYEDLDRLDEEQGLLLRFRESTYRLISDFDLSETFKKSYELELKLIENGCELLYCTESDANRYLESNKYEAVIYPPKLKKQQARAGLPSGLVDNIPLTATFAPILSSWVLGGVSPDVWWGLVVEANLGGSLTPIGSPSNIIVLGVSEREGHPISLGMFFKICFGVTMVHLFVSMLYLYVMYSI